MLEIAKEEVFEPLAIHEYFLFDISLIIKKLKENMKLLYPNSDIKNFESQIEDVSSDNIFAREKDDVLEEFLNSQIRNLGCEKFGASLNFEAVCENLQNNANKYSFELYEIVLKRINKTLEEKAKGYEKEALTNIRGNVVYEKVTSKI